jgi:hypothetical protein
MSSRHGSGRLPDFVVIGAAKSGTTALHEYLRQHPQICMSRRKEPNFFAFDQRPPDFRGPFDRTLVNRDSIWRLADYERQFDRARPDQRVGEVSPKYLSAEGSAERMRRLIPEARLVAVLRQPADRAWSHFSMLRRDGFEPCATLEEAIADEPRRQAENWSTGRHFERGLYAKQLRRVYDRFPREQIRVYLYDDFTADPEALFRDLFRFLGVEPGFVPDMARRPNVSGDVRNPVLRWLWTRPGARSFVRPFLPKALRQAVSGWVIRHELIRREMPLETRSWLTELYGDEILRLQELLGRDLSAWLEPRPSAASTAAPANMPRNP